MNRTERLYKINELLRAHKVVSFATLLAKVEASRSTLKRDLKYLCERLNNPITHHDDLGGYRIEPTQGHAGRPHELPGLWFSPTEISAPGPAQLCPGCHQPGGAAGASRA